MRTRLHMAGLLWILLVGGNAHGAITAREELTIELDRTIQQTLSRRPDLKSVSAFVQSKAKGFTYSGAAGCANGLEGARCEMMSLQHKFRTASESKMLTAVLIMQLIEDGKLGLEDSVIAALGETGQKILRGDALHVIDGKGRGREITIRQLLNHSSGLADYIFADPRFIEGVFLNPEFQWNAEAIFESYFKYGINAKAPFLPGTGYHYADTNYAILAMLVERLRGQPLYDVLKERIFEPLAMGNTYLEWYGPARGSAPLSHPFFGDIDALPINTSFDWGGGGIVSTHEDRNQFIRGLFSCKLFRSCAPLATMIDWEKNSAPTHNTYGLGIGRIRIDTFEFIGHAGAYGSALLFDPRADLTVALTFNQAQDPNEGELAQMISAILAKYCERL